MSADLLVGLFASAFLAGSVLRAWLTYKKEGLQMASETEEKE
jgi:hypothetical protein